MSRHRTAVIHEEDYEPFDEVRNREDWFYLADKINKGEDIFHSSTQWESARIGLSVFDDPACQKAAALCETHGKYLRRSKR